METAAWLLIIGIVFLIQILVLLLIIFIKIPKINSVETFDVSEPIGRNDGELNFVALLNLLEKSEIISKDDFIKEKSRVYNELNKIIWKKSFAIEQHLI